MRMRGSIGLAAISVVLALGAGPAQASGTPGELDTLFGSGGVLTEPGQRVDSLAVRTSDGAVATGSYRQNGVNSSGAATYEWAIRRYTASGQVDTSFALGGPFTRFGDNASDRVYALAFDGAGRLLAAGVHVVAVVTGSGRKQTTTYVPRGVVLRLDNLGALDTTFGSGGQVVFDFPLYAMALLPGGQILVAGSRVGDPATAQLLADGSLDGTYGSGGVAVDARWADACGRVMGVALQSTGAAVLAWRGSRSVTSKGRTTTTQVWHVTRMTAAGSADAAFASAERTNHYVGGLVVGPDDRVYATGATDASSAHVVVTAAQADGTPDIAYGAGGETTWSTHATQLSVGSPVLQADGALVIPSHHSDGAWRAAPVRLLADGTLDASFGPSGEGDPLALAWPSGGDQTWAWGLALAPDGGILMFGIYNYSYVARYVP